jgi:phage-related protein
MKPIHFLGSSLQQIREFPDDARSDVGYQLAKIQKGEAANDGKPMPSVGIGVEEIRIWETRAPIV